MTSELGNRYATGAIVTTKAAAAAATFAVGALVLAGWWLNIGFLQSIVPGAPAMKPNTALSFLLAGAALWLLETNASDRRLLAVRRVCAGLVTLIGLLTLAEYAFG